MKKRILTFLLAIGLSTTVLAMPAYAEDNKLTMIDENFILINPKSLQVQKNNQGVLYWKVTPKRFVTAMNSLSIFSEVTEDISYVRIKDITKTKDKNIFNYKNKNVTLSFYTLGSSYSESYIYKIVVQMNHSYTIKENDISVLSDLVSGCVGVFTAASIDDAARILESVDYDGEGGIITNKTVQYEFLFDDESTFFIMTPYQKTTKAQ